MHSDYQRYTGDNMTIYGDYNHVDGHNNVVHGDYNAVTGNHNRCNGDYNTVVGNHNHCNGDFNEMSGQHCTNTGDGNNVNGGTVTTIHSGTSTFNFTANQTKKKQPAPSLSKPSFVEGPTPPEAEHDTEALDDATACVICLDNVPNCIAIPCMHMVYCVACARIICFGADGTELKKKGTVECVECRAHVDAIKRVFVYMRVLDLMCRLGAQPDTPARHKHQRGRGRGLRNASGRLRYGHRHRHWL